MIAPAIHLRHISLAYQGVPIFTNLNLSLRGGKWTALLGKSGVGKSSLLRIIAGLTSPEETLTGSISADNTLAVNQQVAWMGQSDMLLPWLTTLDNLLLGIQLRSAPHAHLQSATVRARELLSKAGLGHAEALYPHQLSGGMRQRIALLRTLMEDKPIVLMDEPFSALDTLTRYQLHQLAIDLLRDKTVLFVTHDPAEALRLAEDIYLLTSQALVPLGHLSSPTPRAPHEPALMQLQADIYARLLPSEEIAA